MLVYCTSISNETKYVWKYIPSQPTAVEYSPFTLVISAVFGCEVQLLLGNDWWMRRWPKNLLMVFKYGILIIGVCIVKRNHTFIFFWYEWTFSIIYEYLTIDIVTRLVKCSGSILTNIIKHMYVLCVEIYSKRQMNHYPKAAVKIYWDRDVLFPWIRKSSYTV